MEKTMILYFIYDDNFVIRDIFCNEEEAKIFSKVYGDCFVRVHVQIDSDVSDLPLTIPQFFNPPIDGDCPF